ncbi:MAG: hypothetical protein JW982_02590 [Spirochaetes bacterium]|nr:hypothetical protein [Spirochaetota bacterium]
MNTDKLYKKGKEKYNLFYIIFSNLFFFLQIAFGFYIMLPVKIAGIPLISIAYLSYILFMHLYFLRKHMCSTCYYYGKKCHFGWGGKIACLYKENGGKHKLGGIFSGITWIIIMLVPFFTVILDFYFNLRLDNIILIIPYVFLMSINSIIHKRDCDHCKMKNICHGSASRRYKEIKKTITDKIS